jgi:hypothetical protein
LSYLFPRVEAGLFLSYQHGAAAEVLIGQLTLSDALTLRLSLPLPRGFSLSTSAGFRHAVLVGADGLSTTQFDPTTGMQVPLGQSYDLLLADAGLSWRLRDSLVLSARYEYMQQFVEGDAPLGSFALVPYDRHLALFGVSYLYPSR